MRRVVLSSANPVKRRAVELGFGRMFPDEEVRIEAVEVDSGVGEQPRSDAETRRGAENRAAAARAAVGGADFWVGIEGGIDDGGREMTAFAWVVVLGRDTADPSRARRGASRTGTFQLPGRVADLVRQGVELGEADDRVFGRSDSKRKEGAVGLLTGGVVDRAELYAPSVVFALIPFRHRELY